MTEEYITQVSKEIERRLTKKLSQYFSRTESRILFALSKLHEILLIPQAQTCSLAVPGTSRNNDSKIRERTGNRALIDPYTEVEFSACRTKLFWWNYIFWNDSCFFFEILFWNIERTKQMTGQDENVNLGKSVFDENNQERKSWACLVQTCSRSWFVCLAQLFVILWIIFGCFWRTLYLKTWDESTMTRIKIMFCKWHLSSAYKFSVLIQIET